VYFLPRTFRTGSLCALATTFLICLSAFESDAAKVEVPRVKRVLILHSFGRDFAPYNAVSSVFRTELTRQSAAPVEFFEVSLETARVTESGSEIPIVEYLRVLTADRLPALVVPFGAPAVNFLTRHRRRLFPDVPILFSALDQRHFKNVRFGANATAVTVRLDLPGIIENILHVLPGTKTVAVVTGNSPIERFWLTQLRQELQPFTSRVQFIWLNELSFESMRKRLGALPPNSAIFYALLLVDAAGVPHEQERALEILHSEAIAPIFGVFDSQLGRGILGGPLYPTQEVSRESVRLALRILGGEQPSSMQPLSLGAGAPVYDWRELKRWNISESRLPSGSIVRFREPTIWEQYRWYVIAALAIIAIQAALIADLLLQHARRRRSEADLQRNRGQLAHVTRISTMGELAASLAHELNQPLTAILSNVQAAQRFLDANPADLKEVHEILEDIVADNNRASEVIRRMRRLVKKEELDFAPVNIASVIGDVVQLVHTDGILRNIRVDVECQGGLPSVKGDRVQLQQVVINLLINAFDAMKDGTAKQRNVQVRAKMNGAGMVEISVQDHGTGLTSDNLEKIFQPFYTTKREGLGMGLPISRSITEAHGGRLWAENNADGGATFYLTVPALDGEEALPAADRRTSPQREP
jgi:signal transduction histidine kinase